MPDLSFPAYYDMHGIPVRKLREAALPEKMSPDGTWTPMADPERFGTEAHRVEEPEFNALVDAFRAPQTTA